jgi:hypothetical protein
MGSRPSQFGKGGGYLNNVNVTIQGYVFTDAFPGKSGELEPFTPGKIKSFDDPKKLVEKPHNLNLVWTIRVDDAKEDQYLPLKASSNFDNFIISDDGLTVTTAEGGRCSINQNTAAAKFVASFVKSGIDAGTFSEDELSDDEDSINFEPLVGRRVRLVRRVDAERTKKYGLKTYKGADGKIKSNERDDLLVDDVYTAEDTAASAPTQPAKKAATTKSAAAVQPVAAKGKSAAKAATVDVPALAISTLKDVLRAKGGTIEKSKLSMAILLKLTKDPNREDVRKYLFDDENLGAIPNVGYDAESGVIALDE